MPNQVWKANLTSIITGGGLFSQEIYSPDENPSSLYHAVVLFNRLCKYYFPQMDLTERRIILSQYCKLLGNNSTPFQIKMGCISDIYSIIDHLRSSLATHPHELSDILYSLLVVFVRQADDVQSFVEKESRIRKAKPQMYHDDFFNARFYAFLRNEVYTPPSSSYDKYGIRFTYDTMNVEIGDIVIYTPRSEIFDLFCRLCIVICKIISFFKPQSTDNLPGSTTASSYLRSPLQQGRPIGQNPNASMRGVGGVTPTSSGPVNPSLAGANSSLNPSNSSTHSMNPNSNSNSNSNSNPNPSSNSNPNINSNSNSNPSSTVSTEIPPLPFTERFVSLIYRFIIAFFNCGGLYRVEINHPLETVRFGHEL